MRDRALRTDSTPVADSSASRQIAGVALLGDVGPAESRDAQHQHVALRRPRFRGLRGHRGQDRRAHAEGRDQPDPPVDPGADVAHRSPARAAA